MSNRKAKTYAKWDTECVACHKVITKGERISFLLPANSFGYYLVLKYTHPACFVNHVEFLRELTAEVRALKKQEKKTL